MHKKTVSKILVAIIMTSMLIAIVPTLPVGATTLASLTPNSGNVGTTVTVIGTIDTLGGGYNITYDGTLLKQGNAPADSYEVNDTIVIPSSLGSDAGLNHVVGLIDISTTNIQTANFAVVTSRTVTATPTYGQEGDGIVLNITVTGGTTANTLNDFDLEVTDPDGSIFPTTLSFTTSPTGSGSNTVTFVATMLTGTYMVAVNRTLPGVITDAASTSFDIGLTNASSYGRFETVNVQTAGWANDQNVTVTITDPSAAVVEEWVNQTLATGMDDWDWTVPWNATLGDYTVTVVNATGDDKDIQSTQVFSVVSADLDVDITLTNPPPLTSPLMRTEIAMAEFTIQYPDLTYYENVTSFSSIIVSVYYNTTLVTTIPLSAADYDGSVWMVEWQIPRNAVLGSDYVFQLDEDSITDTVGNVGPTEDVESESFEVEIAELSVEITQEPAENYTRTEPAMAKINITYPDNTFYTDADYGNITVRVYTGEDESVANLTLTVEDFNSTTNEWTIAWASPYDAELTSYWFEIEIDDVIDAANPNMGPTSDVSTESFELLTAVINVESVNTDDTSYRPGEYVILSFVATYADGSPVVTGTSTVTLMAPDGFTTVPYNPVHTSAGTWAITIWLSDAQAQLGAWNITLAANGLDDGAGNTGPAVARTNSFTVLESEVTLETLSAEIQALESKLNTITADVNGMKAAINSLTSAVSSLTSDVTSIKTAGTALAADIDLIDEVLGYTAGVVAELQTALGTLSTTAATKTEVAAVSSVVSGLSADLTALKSSVAALNTAVADSASTADVDTTVNEAVDAAVTDLTADIAALETSLNALSNTVDDAATQADLDAAASDLDSSIAGLNTMVIIAVVLALIAAIAAIAAVFIIQRKIAG